MKFMLKLKNIFKLLKNSCFCVLISLSSILTVSADEENPKTKNSSNIFRQTKTDRKFGEQCLLPTECQRSMHLTCHLALCDCDEGYHKVVNNTDITVCVSDITNNGLAEYFENSPMLPILIVLAIMFVGICVVLHLFARARFRKSRSIFVNPRTLKVAKAQERRASQLSQLSHRSNNGGLRSPCNSYRSPRNSFVNVSPTDSYTGRTHNLEPNRSPNNRSRSNSTSSMQIHLKA